MKTLVFTDADVRVLIASMTFLALLAVLLVPDSCQHFACLPGLSGFSFFLRRHTVGARSRHIFHLLGKNLIADSRGPQRYPVAGGRKQRLPLREHLVLHNLYAAEQVVLGLQDGSGWVFSVNVRWQ